MQDLSIVLVRVWLPQEQDHPNEVGPSLRLFVLFEQNIAESVELK